MYVLLINLHTHTQTWSNDSSELRHAFLKTFFENNLNFLLYFIKFLFQFIIIDMPSYRNSFHYSIILYYTILSRCKYM